LLFIQVRRLEVSILTTVKVFPVKTGFVMSGFRLRHVSQYYSATGRRNCFRDRTITPSNRTSDFRNVRFAVCQLDYTDTDLNIIIIIIIIMESSSTYRQRSYSK